MDVKITKAVKGGKVRAIGSKSAAHRLLICAALADSETFISCEHLSLDIEATINCLKMLGADIIPENNGLLVKPFNRFDINNRYSLDCGESGSTFRFLLPVCGALGLNVSFILGGRLPLRPLSALYDEMTSHGCVLSKPGISPFSCRGMLTSGIYTLPGNITSQFISGLLFALPLLNSGKVESFVNVTGILESRPYVDMSLDTLRLFGIRVYEEKDKVFRIPGGQVFRSPKTVKTEGDWSNAAFWLCAGAIGKNDGSTAGAVTVTGLNPESGQGDKKIVDILKLFGANIVCENDSVTVSPGKLCGIDIDAADIPDLVPVLAAVASAAEGKTVIRNAGRLRMKESDRLQTAEESLSALGADIKQTENGLVIIGKKSLPGGETESFGDHRIIMSAAILSAVCTGTVTIREAQVVNKSYPDFFKDFMTALGGECIIK